MINQGQYQTQQLLDAAVALMLLVTASAMFQMVVPMPSTSQSRKLMSGQAAFKQEYSEEELEAFMRRIRGKANKSLELTQRARRAVAAQGLDVDVEVYVAELGTLFGLSKYLIPPVNKIILVLGPEEAGLDKPSLYVELAHEAGHAEQYLKGYLPVPPLTALYELDAIARGLKFARSWGVEEEYLDQSKSSIFEIMHSPFSSLSKEEVDTIHSRARKLFDEFCALSKKYEVRLPKLQYIEDVETGKRYKDVGSLLDAFGPQIPPWQLRYSKPVAGKMVYTLSDLVAAYPLRFVAVLETGEVKRVGYSGWWPGLEVQRMKS